MFVRQGTIISGFLRELFNQYEHAPSDGDFHRWEKIVKINIRALSIVKEREQKAYPSEEAIFLKTTRRVQSFDWRRRRSVIMRLNT